MEKKISIGGFLPTTTIDYPEHISAVIFCKGCSWNCKYCHNRHLSKEKKIEWDKIENLLKKRKNLLEAVVFSGGEPTEQKHLLDYIKKVKAMGFKVGLHTNGNNPKILAEIIEHTDWIGLDIKTLKEEYPKITGIENSGEFAFKSLNLVLKSGIDYEVRTTVHSDLISYAQLGKLAEILSEKGVKNYAVQLCLTDSCLEKNLSKNSFDVRDFSELFENFTVRNEANTRTT